MQIMSEPATDELVETLANTVLLSTSLGRAGSTIGAGLEHRLEVRDGILPSQTSHPISV